MDYKKWSNNINKLNIYDNLKNNLLSFGKLFNNNMSLSFVSISDNKIINALNNINNYKTLLICLDIEFQSMLNNDNSIYEIVKMQLTGDYKSMFIKELGMLLFIRENVKSGRNNWYYIGSMFVNFDNLLNYGINIDNIKLVGLHYSTVSDKTYKQMLENENILVLDNDLDNITNHPLFDIYFIDKNKDYVLSKLNEINNVKDDDLKETLIERLKAYLNKIQFELFGSYLSDVDKKYKDAVYNSNKLYWNDDEVKKRNIKKHVVEFYDYLQKFTRDTIYVVKGKMDFMALQNSYKLVTGTNDKIYFNDYYDIEVFNGFSKYKFNSAQLGETYDGLIKLDIYKGNAKKLFDIIGKNIGDKAHNPVVDSLFTIVVAVVINMGMNDCFNVGNKKKYNGGKYEKEYLKYKQRYLKSK